MVKIPDIVKILREEEKQGVLLNKIHSGVDGYNVNSKMKTGKISETTCILQSEFLKSNGSDNICLLEGDYKTIFDNCAVGITIVNDKEQIISWNKYAEKILGMKKKDLYLKPIKSLYPADEWRKIRLENIRKKGLKHHLETKIIKKNNKLIDVDLSLSVLKDNAGKVIGSIGIIKDISQSKKFEKRIVYEQELLQSLLDNIPDSIHFKDEKNRFIKVNKAKARYFNVRPEDMIGKTDFDFLSDEEAMRVFSDDLKLMKTGRAIVNKIEKITDSKGRKHLVSVTKIPRYDQNGRIIGTMGISRDLSKLQKAKDEIKKSEENYRLLTETSADGIITINNLGKIVYVNPSFESMCMKGKGELTNSLFREHLSDESIYLFQQFFLEARKLKNKIENIELEIVRDDGSLVPVEINISPIRKNSDFSGLICMVRDISERKKVENELRKSEHLKTEFMNIAAHELKSPVTPIKGYLDLIIHDEETNDKIKNWAKISLRNSERLLRLVDDILDVARLNSDTMRFEMETVDMTNLLGEIVEDMRTCVEEKNIKFVTNIPKVLPQVMGDRSRLLQSFRNIIGNAVKFTDKGMISVEAKKEDHSILVTIEDTGIGVSNGEVKKIFTKFYQAYTGNDRNNEGTGLGLFICKEIVEKHNGKIWAESELKKGSKFFIKIPHL